MLCKHGGTAHQAAIVAAGTAPVLVSLLASRHEPLQRAAAATIRLLTCAGTASIAFAFLNAGAVQALVDCLSSTSNILMAMAAGAIANLTADGPACASFEAAQAGVMPHLVQLLSNNTDLRDSAALALGNIASDLLEQPQLATFWKAAFLAAGAVPATARLLAG